MENFYNIINKYFFANYDVVYFKPISINLKDEVPSKRHLLYQSLVDSYLMNPNKINELNIKYKFYVPWSKLIRRNFLNENKIYFDEVSASNDVIFSTKVGHFSTNFSVSFEEIYCVTEDNNTLTSTKTLKNFKSRFTVFITYHTFLKEKLNDKDFKLLSFKKNGFLIGSLKFFNIFLSLQILKMFIKLKIPIL